MATKNVNTPEILLQIEDIQQGDKFTRKLVLDSYNPHYDQKTIEYRALNGEEFSKAMRNAGLTKNVDPADSIDFLVEACKIGVVPQKLGESIAKIRDTGLISTIGSAILNVSKPSEQQIKN